MPNHETYTYTIRLSPEDEIAIAAILKAQPVGIEKVTLTPGHAEITATFEVRK